MTVYRYTFDLHANAKIRSPELQTLWDETYKYLSTVLVPKSGKLHAQAGAELASKYDTPRTVHLHNGDECDYCRELANDAIS
jgi:hypothetical protein